jgi:hypothetical protein
MIRLTGNQVRILHRDLIVETGGTGGVRDEGLLDSALQLPFQTFDGQALYPSLSKSGLPGKNPGRPQSIEDTYRQKTAGKREAIAVLLSIWPAF